MQKNSFTPEKRPPTYNNVLDDSKYIKPATGTIARAKNSRHTNQIWKFNWAAWCSWCFIRYCVCDSNHICAHFKSNCLRAKLVGTGSQVLKIGLEPKNYQKFKNYQGVDDSSSHITTHVFNKGHSRQARNIFEAIVAPTLKKSILTTKSP